MLFEEPLRVLEQWRDPAALSEIDRWIVRMGIGYFSAAEGIVGDNVIHVVRLTGDELERYQASKTAPRS